MFENSCILIGQLPQTPGVKFYNHRVSMFFKRLHYIMSITITLNERHWEAGKSTIFVLCEFQFSFPTSLSMIDLTGTKGGAT